MASSKKILLVHGAGAKPGADDLLRLWREALKTGVARDEPKKVEQFAATPTELFYFADRLAHLHDDTFDPKLDVTQREQVLEHLSELGKARDFRRRRYEELPGKSPLKEFAMDVGASLGLGQLFLARAMPELSQYWSDRDGWATRLRRDFAAWLAKDLVEDSDVLLITHCLGSVLAYDGLWELKDNGSRVSMWLTLGSPLASSAVNRRLRGARAKGADRYPRNLLAWHNISAEDDFVCHDKTVSDDYRAMLDARLIGDITDHTIYNLAVRYGRSNPHHSAGYLVHPRTTRYVVDWLAS